MLGGYRTPQHPSAAARCPVCGEGPAGGKTLASKRLGHFVGMVWGPTPATQGEVCLPSYGLLEQQLSRWPVLKRDINQKVYGYGHL